MEWMGQYKEVSELIIKVMNEYTFIHKKQINYGDDESISFSEAQVIEEIIRHKDSNMTDLSKELGVTKAAITKTMKKLENKGFITRFKQEFNKKEIFVSITKKGHEIYKHYQEYMYTNLFGELFQMFSAVDPSHAEMIFQFFNSVDKSLSKISLAKL
ncbi:MAG: hypothetical protein B6229_02995 [Spirochaetaceae bacterium 4572_7]|nr:MAG: hypothetical protein B6229_02995 [Spirochaetaceae bacterium 4572_7]